MALSDQERDRVLIAAQRFGLGLKAGAAPDVIAGLAKDPRGVLRRETWDPSRLFVDDDRLMTTQVALEAHFKEQRAELAARNASREDAREMRVARGRSGPDTTGGGMTGGGMMAPAAAQAPPQPQIEQVIYRNEAMARARMAMAPDVGFGERLVLFWSNHFCVSIGKGQIARATAGAMEREAIRPHVLGRFADMLLAVEKHPAMLFYLDNRQSVGPNSRAGRNRHVGLNENLAREILELHTLGVDGGYTQADVTSLAKIITGWTFVGPGERLGPAGTFFFAANRHEPGDQTVLGRVYRDTGVEQGETALRDLARHPATALHIARKLARHFIADVPPTALVEALARVFRDTDGDLAEVSRALVSHDLAWSTPLAKVRNPYEMLVAAYRALSAPRDFGQIAGPLAAMGMPLWSVPGPNGWPESAAHWTSPEAMRAKLDVAATLGRWYGQSLQPEALADQLFPDALSPETRQAIRRAETRAQGVAILLMSPEFQRR